MHASKRASLAAVFALGLLGLGTSAQAGSTWVTANNCSDPGTGFGNTSTCSNSGGNATLTGWSNTANASGSNTHSGTTATGGKIETAALMLYTWKTNPTVLDFGVKNQNVTAPSDETTAPEHSIDNEVNVDMVLLKFDTASILSAFKLGWISGDSDVTILRYDGSGTTAAGILGGLTLGNLTANSWTVINNYSDVASDTTQNTGADTTKGSSWWLISAYNSSFGTKSYTSGSSADAKLSDGNDYFKLLAYQASTPTGKTPEPSSLALAGLALFGMVGLRRKAKRV